MEIANQDLIKALGRAHECTRRLLEAGLSFDDLQMVIDNPEKREHLVKFWKKQSSLKKVKVKSPILRLISGNERLTIKALDGKRIIAEAKDTFKSYLDPDFINWGLNKVGIATLETPVEVHEMIKNAMFKDIFNSLPGTLEEKCLTQNQVIEFCETLPDWLAKNNNATMFLCKKDEHKPIDAKKPQDNLVVVHVLVLSDGFFVHVRRFGDGSVWRAEYRRRLVAPQLNPLAV